MRILILGGTSEARQLSQRVAGNAAFEATLSLAGRTINPWLPPIPFRIGGFGGVEGLRDYLATEKIEAVIDATHPFAMQMSENARLACAAARLPLAVLTRPEWQAQAGDRWTVVDDIEAAVEALGETPRRVLLTMMSMRSSCSNCSSLAVSNGPRSRISRCCGRVSMSSGRSMVRTK